MMNHKFEDLPHVMTVEEVSKILRIGRSNAYALVRSGPIRAVKVGRIYRVPKAAVEDYLRAGC